MKKKVGLTCFLLIWTSLVSAATWSISPGITTRLFFTDNLFLTPDNEESDTAVQILPSITARRTGARAKARFAYGPSLLFYANNSDLNTVYQVLQAEADLELVERIFFLDIAANANPYLINPRDRAAFDVVNNPDAFTQTASLRITPEIRAPVISGDYAEVRLRPGVNYSFAADSAAGARNDGVTGTRTQLDIDSGRFFSRMPWSLNYSRSIFDVDTNDGFGRVSGSVGYRFTPKYRLDLTLGYDKGRYTSRNDTSGVAWRVTGTWTPSGRTDLSLGIGEAYFGNDWRLRFRHRHKHSVWTAEYDVDVQSVRQEIIDSQVVPFEDAFGNPILDPLTGQPTTLEVGTPALVDDVYVRDRFRLGWAWFRGRTNVNLTLRYDRRNYQALAQDTKDGVAYLNLSRRLTRRLTGRVGLDYWNHTEDNPLPTADFEEYRARVGLSYRLGPRTDARLDLLRTDRSADNRLDEYTENRLDLTVSYNWNRGL
jgi:uncharacterized protein (PEP-CTERM system associated)